MPTLTASAPASTSASAASPVAMLPPMTCDLREVRLDPAHPVKHALRMAVRRIDDDHIHAGVRQRRHAFFRARAGAHRGADAQALLVILAGMRIVAWLSGCP